MFCLNVFFFIKLSNIYKNLNYWIYVKYIIFVCIIHVKYIIHNKSELCSQLNETANYNVKRYKSSNY